MPQWPPKDIPNELLKRERDIREWTQHDVAEKVGGGVDARLVRKWESGTTIPAPHNRKKLAEVFDKRNAWVLGFPLDGEIPFWQVPYRRNNFFTGREGILRQLHDTFLAQRAGSTPRLPLALSGLGGVGKTQIALEYAYRCRDQYYNHTVLWIPVVSSQQLSEDFAALADLLELPEKGETDLDVRIDAVRKWLNQLTRWLLIFDNVDSFQLIERFLPDEVKGHVLLTTRSQSTDTFAPHSLLVEPLDDCVGAELLLHRAKILPLEHTLGQATSADVTNACLHSKNVGGLPLALDQAGAYIEKTDVLLADYLDLYQKGHHALLNERGSLQSPSQHPESVVATLELSFREARKRYQLAGDLLDFCAFLQPDAIPEEVLLQAADPRLDPFSLNGAVAALLDYSLVRRNAQEKTFSIHRLVQEVVVDNMSADRRRHWRRRMVHALNTVFPEVDFQNWTQCGRLIRHVSVCSIWTEDEYPPTLELAQLFHKAGIYLSERGQYADAEPLLERALSVRQQYLGVEHADTATTQHHLGLLSWKQGKYPTAELLLQQAHAARERQLGKDHPETAKSLNGLAALYNSWGRYGQAKEMYLRAFSIFGLLEDEPNRAKVLNNLGELSQRLDDYEQAEKWYSLAFFVKKSCLGRRHLSTIATLNNLAYLYQCTNRFGHAERLYNHVRFIFERTLGSEHPYIAGILYNLADLYRQQGNYEQAEPLYRQSLAIREQHLGKDHPDTAESLHGLARLLQDQGKHDETGKLYQRALAIRKLRLGVRHPDTQRAWHDYVAFLHSIGRSVDATILEEQPDTPSA